MPNSITKKHIDAIKKTRDIKRHVAPWIPLLSLLVILTVFWWLKLTGITLAGEAFCGIEEHTHTEECMNSALPCEKQEHVHTESCYSDLTADLETEETWTSSFASADLTDYLTDDIVAIARTQIGYTESRYNFKLSDTGERLGYTRYGEWYGNPYGKWSAMFASFVLNYAGLPDEAAPYNSGVEAMRVEWEKAALTYNEGYSPIAGDLVFFDKDENGSADSVGIISAVSGETLTVIEGDLGGAVAETAYTASDTAIMSYGSVISAVRAYASAEDIDEVRYVISLIDELPDADEFEAKLAAYEEVYDMTAYEEYVTEVANQVADTYIDYEILGSKLKMLVTNYEKLSELEWLRHTPSVLISEIASDTPTTVKSASTVDIIELNLYDYTSKINTKYNSNNKYPGFQWNGGAYLKDADGDNYDRHSIDCIDFGNSLITDFNYGTRTSNAKSPNAVTVGNKGGAINALDISSYGVVNRPIGYSIGDDVLLRTLKNGYPALPDGTSLAYLFGGESVAYVEKKNTANIDGLFQYDEETGTYYYDSRQNHAQYSNNKFTLYDQIITPNFITYPFGNFLPFNSITSKSNVTQVSKITSIGTYIQAVINDLCYDDLPSTQSSVNQLIDMLALYRTDLQSLTVSGSTAWKKWTAADAINDYFFTEGASGPVPSQNKFTMNGFPYISSGKSLLKNLYNIDYDVEKNFFFGMDMHMKFMQPKGGLTGKSGDVPMVYEFRGDDDVWIYIDGVLFLDLSGIHRHVGGKIDFVNGKVYYYPLNDDGDGDVDATAYKTYTFAEILKAAGKSTDVLNSKGTFADYSEHTFDFYYMERGSGSSVCAMEFNLPLLRTNSISVVKELEGDTASIGNPDFSFQIWKEGGKELLIGAGVSYDVMSQSGTIIRTGVTGANGIFTIKAGERAIFTCPENAGKYFVRELLNSAVFEQYDGQITVDGTAVTVNNTNVTIGNDSFKGLDSPARNISDGSITFIFKNIVNDNKYGSLTVKKEANEYGAAAGKEFSFTLTVDGVPIPAGTSYTLIAEDGTEKTATIKTAGELILHAGETASFGKILAGTKIKLVESSASSEGYKVEYLSTNLASKTNSDTYLEGIVSAGVTTAVTVKNDRNGTKLPVRVDKTLLYPDGGSYSFDFKLVQIVSLTDHSPVSSGITLEKQLTLDGSTTEGIEFMLNFPPDTANGTYYFLISEEGDSPGIDDAEFILEVKTKVVGGGVEIEEQKLYKNGTAVEKIEFVNENLRSLTLSKTVEGESGGSFDFEIELKVGDAPVSGEFKTDGGDTVIFTDGKATLSLNAGESVTVWLPYGAEWTVTETSTGGYIVRSGTAEDSLTDSASVSGALSADAEAHFLNIPSPELPSTGGYGQIPWILSGLVVMLGSLVYAYILRRKTKGGKRQTS